MRGIGGSQPRCRRRERGLMNDRVKGRENCDCMTEKEWKRKKKAENKLYIYLLSVMQYAPARTRAHAHSHFLEYTRPTLTAQIPRYTSIKMAWF